ncbi:MAG: phosphate ABC transporter permease subunit PstC, partial [Actinobacteria bacterium]|nr:phosphate ABC transporter permease subunit PstC [Actinomycetota bacterium]
MISVESVRGTETAPIDPREPDAVPDHEGPQAPEVKPRSMRSAPSVSDIVFKSTAFVAGLITVAIMLAVGTFLSLRAGDAIGVAGLDFLVEQKWSPETHQFGIAAVLFGTFMIAAVAMVVSLPLSFGTALLITEIARGRLQQWLITVVDLMAAVPSVVFGLWGLFFLQANVVPVAQWISHYFGWIPFLAVTDEKGAALTDASAFTSSSFVAGIVV